MHPWPRDGGAVSEPPITYRVASCAAEAELDYADMDRPG